MTSFVKDFFTLNLTVLRYLGFYPSKENKVWYKILARVIYCTCTVPGPSLAAVYLLISENATITDYFDSAFWQVSGFIFKMVPFVFKSGQVRESLFKMDCETFTKIRAEQRRFMGNCRRICRRITWLFLGFCIISMVNYSCVPIFAGIDFPMKIWVPYDALGTNFAFYFTYFAIVFGIGNGAIANGALDPLVAGLSCYASHQLRILKDNLEYLDKYADEELKNKTQPQDKNQIVYQIIVQCIKHQNAIFEFVKEYEEIYSPVIFTQFAASILVICLSCLQLSMIEPFTFTFFFQICFLFTMIIEIFLHSYFGTTLYEESNSVSNSVYMGKWYKFDRKSQRALILIMERSKRPMIITAGKILDVSLVTFTMVLRRAYSLFAVLQNFKVEL